MERVFWGENSEIFNKLNKAINDLNKAISSERCERVYELQKEICTKYGIALRDRVDECYLSDSSEDAKRLPKTYNTYSECIEKIKSRDITVLLNWNSEAEKLEPSEQVERDFEDGHIEKLKDNLKKWMNYCDIDSSYLVPKQSTSSSNPKWIREILDDWRKDL